MSIPSCVGVLTVTTNQTVKVRNQYFNVRIISEHGLHPTKGWRGFGKKRIVKAMSPRDANFKLRTTEHWSRRR